ncbi:MAG: methyl-accepting chemotaxis protein, partial [Kangiellaceae bacterium]
MLKLLLAPGVTIVNQLSIGKKFALIFILYLIPVGYVAHYALTNHGKEINDVQIEIEKLSVIGSFKPVFENMAKSRGLTNSFLNGNQSVKANIESAGDKVNTQLNTIRNLPEFSNLLNVEQNELKSIQTDWQQFTSAMFTMKADKNFTGHSDLINRVELLMSNILESSTLFTDSEHQTSFLIQLTVKNLPAIVDTIGKSRGIGAGVATAGQFNADTFVLLSNFNKQLQQQRSRMAHNFSSATTYNDNLNQLSQSFNQLDQQINNFIDTTSNKLIIPDEIQIGAEQYFSQGTQLIDLTLELYDASYNELKSLLEKREGDIVTDIFINIISSALLIIAALYLFSSVYTSMLSSISKIEKCVNTVAEGNLTQGIQINSQDEMKNIGDDLNLMIENTKNLVLQVSNTTKELVVSAENNRLSSVSTSERIDQQNLEVEQVAAAMNQMSSTVQEVANNAEQTATSTSKADQDSNSGFKIVQSTITSINELAAEISNASSSIDKLQMDVKEISTVLDVIQGIADQTNLLALNAAIEAARAGESGR